jgi:hypothetical protein
MALLNGSKFSKIIRRYRCDDEVLGDVRTHILNNCILSEHLQVAGCLVSVTDNSKRWLLPHRKDRYFDIAFTYWGAYTPGYKTRQGGGSFKVTYEAAEELTYEENGRRKDVKLEEEVLREAKKLINPFPKTIYNG